MGEVYQMRSLRQHPMYGNKTPLLFIFVGAARQVISFIFITFLYFGRPLMNFIV